MELFDMDDRQSVPDDIARVFLHVGIFSLIASP